MNGSGAMARPLPDLASCKAEPSLLRDASKQVQYFSDSDVQYSTFSDDNTCRKTVLSVKLFSSVLPFIMNNSRRTFPLLYSPYATVSRACMRGTPNLQIYSVQFLYFLSGRFPVCIAETVMYTLSDIIYLIRDEAFSCKARGLRKNPARQ